MGLVEPSLPYPYITFELNNLHRSFSCNHNKQVLYFNHKKYYKSEAAMTVRVSVKGWVVIPADLRKRYQLNPGTEVQVIDYGGVLAIVPVKENPIEESAGMLAGGGKSLIRALEDDHDRELEGERQR
jgi:AbrB family looped-hinge helix DNA binding protein